MVEQHSHEVPWIERIAHWVPGYGGYLERGNRRAADQALRDAIAQKLAHVKVALEGVVRRLLDHGELTMVQPLERIERQVSHLADRIRAAGSGTSSFWGSSGVDPGKADSLHAFDYDLLRRVDQIEQVVKVPDRDHDWLPHLEGELNELERKLDERATILQGIQ